MLAVEILLILSIIATRSVAFVNSWYENSLRPARPTSRPTPGKTPNKMVDFDNLYHSTFTPVSCVFVTLSSLRLGWGFTRCPPVVFGEDPVVLVYMQCSKISRNWGG